MANKDRPREGDLVLYDRVARRRNRTATGRVISRHAWGLRVDSTTKKRNHRVEWKHLKGWWPKGTPDRSFDNLREPQGEAA